MKAPVKTATTNAGSTPVKSRSAQPKAPAAEPVPALSAIELAPVAQPALAEMLAAAVTVPDEAAPALVLPVTPAPDPTPQPEPVIATTPEPIIPHAAEPVSSPPQDDAPVQPKPVPAFPLVPAFTRGLFDMATTFDAAATNPAVATEKMKAVFGGLNDRAKTAMEKLPKMGEEMSALTKGNVEALVESGKVVAKGAESLTQEAVEFGKKNFESATAMLKSLAAAKSPTEMFQIQSEFAKAQFDSVVAEASKVSEAWVKLAGEAVQPLQNRYALAAEKLKTAAAG